MDSPNSKNAQKFVKSRSQSPVSSTGKGVVRHISPLQALRNNSGPRDELKERQVDKNKVTKENTTPQDFKLHTKERAVKRALFNYSVATKIYIEERQKRQLEKLQKMIEEEEVKLLRKEMIPRAQLMPYFDRPFFPQRSTRPLTIPKEPRLKLVSG
ncbi:protein TPX2-like [Coffea eugenioides]|uniref:Microtubule-destabilizing protein 60-like n=1 Tax=Coffea arabica TaxID=13443 RepID=A0A6P6TLJ2_COFAR|nr:protein TPX2-like [Coffea arabica]XP_027177575.1 protein TPX2-like [Coffea eugenioides]